MNPLYHFSLKRLELGLLGHLTKDDKCDGMYPMFIFLKIKDHPWCYVKKCSSLNFVKFGHVRGQQRCLC